MGAGRAVIAYVLALLACAALIVAPFSEVDTRSAGTGSSSSSSRTLLAARVPGQASKHPDDEHKPLLPMSGRDVALFILIFIIVALAAGAGIGGGVLLVPLLSMLGGFSFLETVALSNVAIFAGAITNILFNLPRKNPERPGPLIDYDLLLLFGPPIVMGSVSGSKMNYFVPSWISKCLVLAMLAPMTWRMVVKARMLWLAESERKRQALADVKAAAHAAAGKDGRGTADAALGGADKDADSMPAVARKDPDSIADGAGVVGVAAHDEAAAAFEDSPFASHQVYQQQSAPEPEALPLALRPDEPAAAAAMRPCMSDGYAGVRQHLHQRASRLTPGSSLATLQEHRPLAPSTDLVSLLGPELMLLTSPAAAAATLEAQYSSRELQRRRAAMQRGSRSLSTSRNSSQNRTGSIPGGLTASFKRRKGEASNELKGSSSMASSKCSIAKGAVGAALSPSLPVPHDSSSSLPPAAAAGPVGWDSLPEEADGDVLTGPGVAPGVVSPFQLHQRQLSVRPDRQATLQRRMSMRCSSLARRHSSMLQQGGKDVEGSLDQQQWRGAAGVAVGDSRPAVAVGGLLPVAAKSRCRLVNHEGCCHTPELEDKMLRKIDHHISHQYPKLHVSALVGMLLVVVTTSILSQYFLVCGSWQYWVLVLSPLPIMVLVWGLARCHVLWRVGWQECLGLMGQDEINWTPRTTLLYPAIAISVGVLAGLLGLGGGTILAPMLLELGVHPQTSAASSQAAMLISTATSSVVYLVAGDVPQDYGISIALIGFFGTLLGQTAICYLVRRTGRCSLLVFILALLFVLALGAGVGVVGLALAKVVQQPARLGYIRKDELCH